jgi:hypothetical protein
VTVEMLVGVIVLGPIVVGVVIAALGAIGALFGGGKR